MKRLAQLVVFGVVAFGCGIGVASAQTGSDRGYAEFTFGPTFGHESSASFGFEGGYRLAGMLGIFAEAGRMQNVLSDNLETKAQTIGNFLGATVDAKQPATYFDAGVALTFPLGSRLSPYVLFGVGVAKIDNDVTFHIGGNDITGQLANAPYFVQLGDDLSGNYSKVFGTAGLGARITIAGRWMADASYRFGRIGANSDADLKASNSNRLQFGLGLTF